MKPLNGDAQHREKASHYGDHEETIEELEMVAALLYDRGNKANNAIQQEGEGEEGGGDSVRVGEETVKERSV